MSIANRVATLIAANEASLPEIRKRVLEIQQRITGWSSVYHYLFFKSVLDATAQHDVMGQRTSLKSILVLGVYMGRDIAFICDAAPARELEIIGVDKFSDTPCDDWPEEKKKLGWINAGFGAPPSAETALSNIAARPPHAIRLIQAEDSVWLASVQGKWDWIWVDASHDKASVGRQLKQLRPLCHEHTIISGDDYAPLEKSWGVDAAVKEAFISHHVIADTIWFTSFDQYRDAP